VRRMHGGTVDWASVAQGFTDDRLWVATGLVEPDTGDGQRSVLFTDDETGAALPFPTVMVKLVSSGVVLPCRVASAVAGEGEGEWYPFVPGDEVLVALPDGDERGGAVIIGRLNQGLDTFPTSVAGNDPTTNTFGFRRMRAPYVLETASSYTVRSALTGAFFAIDKTGAISLTTGDGHYLALGPDLLGLQTADTSCSVQVNPSTSQTSLQAKSTSLVLDDSSSAFMTSGTLSVVANGGGYAPGHAVTVEEVVGLVYQVLVALAPAISAVTSSPGVPLTPLLVQAAVIAALPAAATGSIAAFTDALTAALKLQEPDPTGLAPGLARLGVLL